MKKAHLFLGSRLKIPSGRRCRNLGCSPTGRSPPTWHPKSSALQLHLFDSGLFLVLAGSSSRNFAVGIAGSFGTRFGGIEFVYAALLVTT